MSRQVAAWGLAAALLCLPSEVRASDVRDIPEGDDRITVLREGEKAPFSGQLFDPPTALRWSNWILQYQFRLQAETDLHEKLLEAERDLWARKLEIQQEKYTRVTESYQSELERVRRTEAELLDRVQNQPWYTSVWFGVVAGAAFTGACVGLGAFLAN